MNIPGEQRLAKSAQSEASWEWENGPKWPRFPAHFHFQALVLLRTSCNFAKDRGAADLRKIPAELLVRPC